MEPLMEQALIDALPDPSTSQMDAALYVPAAVDPPFPVLLICPVSCN